MGELDLAPYLITPGERVVCRRVESQRARDAANRKRLADLRRASAFAKAKFA